MVEQSNTKRIAKNTLMLYFRQILIMLVSLYTVRVVLNILGAEDYGIYNVVAGVVVLFSFVNNAMANGTQRYLNFYLGKGDVDKTKQVYSSSILIHFFIAIIFVIVAETVGLWFTNYKLNIPEGRHHAAMVLYQFTIITTVFSILRVPYNAVIIAYERMSFFALLSIIETILKLMIVFALKFFPNDKLILYSVLLTLISIIITFVYKIFCNKEFEIAHYNKVKDIALIKEMLGFSGWSLFGAVANMANSQGTNIAVNMFTNVTVNAAMGIANQVNSAVYSFVGNFQTAFNPQIVKSYAEDDKKYFMNLIFKTSKLSFLLLSFIAVPLLSNTGFVLKIWLKNIPDYSTHFVQLIILWSLIDSWNGPLWMSVQATGKIRTYQILVSLFIFFNLPLTIVALYFGASPEWVLIIRIIINLYITFWRIFYLSKKIQLKKLQFIYQVIIRTLLVFVISCIGTILIGSFIKNEIIRFFITCFIGIIFVSLLSLLIGVNKMERKELVDFISKKIKRG